MIHLTTVQKMQLREKLKELTIAGLQNDQQAYCEDCDQDIDLKGSCFIVYRRNDDNELDLFVDDVLQILGLHEKEYSFPSAKNSVVK